MQLDAAGWVDEATQVPSPNCDERPPETRIELLVVHAISLPPGEYGGPHIAALFQNRLTPELHPYFETIHQLRVSAHFLIDRQGGLFQFVSCLRRAWHAGVSCWKGRERCNDFSIGIELEGGDDEAFTDAQYLTLRQLVLLLRDEFSIQEILGHSDIAPGRKIDPGPYFDWARVPPPTR